MSLRAVVMGGLFALFVAIAGHFNDVYMGQTYLVGNLFPISVIGFLVILVLGVNPILRRLPWSRPFSPAELVTIVALPLATCVIPGSGFLRTFTPSLLLPHHYLKMVPSWQQQNVMQYFPSHLLAQVTPQNEDRVLAAFLQGLGKGGRHIGLGDIPWDAWLPPLTAWVPLFLVLMLGLIGLCLVFHRQWSAHEHLVYPVAEFVSVLTRSEADSETSGSALRTRLFWGGLLPVLVIHIVNGLHAWYPNFIEIPHRIKIWPVSELFPRVPQTWGGWALFSSEIYFTVLAFSYFLPSDITLSLGLTNLVRTFFAAALMTYGVSSAYTWMGDGELQGLMFGAYVAVFLLIAFSGRAYYARVLVEALGGRSRDPRPPRSAVWGCRVCLLCLAIAAGLMLRLGLPWAATLFLIFALVLMFTAMTRICAETGLFFIQPSWQPAGVLLGLVGAPALGPRVVAIAALLCVVVSIDPREAMMPYIANALRMADHAGVRHGRLAAAMAAVLIVGVFAGLVMVLWLQYDRGVGLTDVWATTTVPQMPFSLVDGQLQKLKADGQLEASLTAGFAERFALIRPNRSFLVFTLLGFVLFSLCAVLRLRFSRWPLHPILFLVWYSYPALMFSTSFLFGWLLKTMVVRLGGGRAYQRGKPMMIGMVAGDLLGGLIFMVVGALYYAMTGFPPKRFGIFPG